MVHVILIVRIIGVLLALFLASTVFFALSGTLYSEEVPPLAQRMLSALPAAFLSILLLLPQSLFLRGLRCKVLVIAYTLAAIAVLGVVGRDLWDYQSGGVHWGIIPTGITAFLIILGNGLALWAQQRELPPNNSFKPNPLRGSA